MRVLTCGSGRVRRAPAGARVRAVAGPLPGVLAGPADAGFGRPYAGGGQTLSALRRAGLPDRVTRTRVPVLLGVSVPLFAQTGPEMRLAVRATWVWPSGFLQTDLAPG